MAAVKIDSLSYFAHFFKNSEKVSAWTDLLNTRGVRTYFWKWFIVMKHKNLQIAAHLTFLGFISQYWQRAHMDITLLLQQSFSLLCKSLR